MSGTWFKTLRVTATALALGVAAAAQAQAQNAVLRGTVTSDGGQPVGGASVYIAELGIQAATTDNGRFTVTVAGDRVRNQQLYLRVRAIGYRPNSRLITLSSGDQTIDFTLATDINRLEEIVVTGVLEGTEQGKVPFTVARVDVADIPAPAVDPLRMLAGRVPGANITSGSGRPGSAPSVLLRGPTSINASGRTSEPLYIVDGIIVNGSLPDINPGDIENVEVVKGAAASSLYGARAGNGVIQITTRSGRRSRDGITFELRSEVGNSDIERDFGIARNTYMMMDERNERFCVAVTSQPLCARTVDYRAEQARINNVFADSARVPISFPLDAGSAPPTALVLRNTYNSKQWPGRTYNAVDQVVNPQIFNNTQFDVTARFGETQVFASAASTRQGGAIRYMDGYTRNSARLNVDQRIGRTFSLALRTYYGRSKEDGLDQEGGGSGVFFRLTRVPAIVDLLARDTLGRLYVRPNLQGSGQQNQNPLIDASLVNDQGTTERFIGGVTGRWTPYTWMDLEGNFSYDFSNFSRDQFLDKGYRVTSFAVNSSYVGSVFRSARVNESYNTSINLSLRRNLTRDLATRWSFRYLYEQRDEDNRSGQGNTLAAVGVPTLDNTTANRSVASSFTSIRQVGLFAGVTLDYKDRYVVEGLIRRDGSSLFGAENRWATFGRGSVAWRVSREPWWFAPNMLSDFKLRASRGSAGGSPRFSAQYETFAVGVSGISFGTLGNRNLRPEITVDNEVGIDAELWRRIGVTLTYASSRTTDQILQVPAPSATGFANQWQNAGTLENKTWELSLNLPIIARRDLNWSWRVIYDRTRTTITELSVPPFTFGSTSQNTGAIYTAQAGERFATFYGRRLAKSCNELPSEFAAQCGGTGSAFQRNSDGWIVWVGQGNSLGDGITRNLFQAQLPACVTATGAGVACTSATAVDTTSPWGVAVNFGMPIIVRDAKGVATVSPIGNGLPDYHFAVSQTLTWRRLSVFALLDAVMGREVWNQGAHWAHLDLLSGDVDPSTNVAEARPIGYYWRAGAPDAGGIGGLYDILAVGNGTTEDASYAKLREFSVSYQVGRVGGIGDWTVTAVGRNLFTITNYTGFDPEVGQGGGLANSAAVNAVDAFNFPNTRTFSLALSTRF